VSSIIIPSEIAESRRNTSRTPRHSSTALRAAQDDEQRRARYFFTISAFSIMAIPPRSAILPFNVIVLPQYSAS
jgi:hypothetical protein